MNKCMELFNQTYYFEFKKTILPCLYEMLTNQNSKRFSSTNANQTQIHAF